MRTASRLITLITLLAAGTGSAAAQTCTQEQFRKVVDEAGSELRRLHAETQPAVQAGLKRLKVKNGWSDDAFEDKANALLTDAKTARYDETVAELLGKLDQLAEGKPSAPVDCSRLGELEATALELQSAVRVKTRYMLTRLDELAGDNPKTAAADPVPPAGTVLPNTTQFPDPAAPKTAPQAPPAKAASKPPAAPVPPPNLAPPKPAPPKPAPAKPAPAKPAPLAGWSTKTDDNVGKGPPPPSENIPTAAVQQPVPQPVPMPNIPLQTEGFSADDIRHASRGFFGTISAGLSNVIEHAFGTFGKPTGYVLGNEGGGAFIAGVRYGRGTLFTRNGRSREVFWHGPSIGYDFGAAGSKTMFLVYGLQDELDIFTGYSGIDGSAYLVGGVGMTVLTNGTMLLAPIRSGVGLRLGASIGYIRITAQPTWNPF